MKVDLGELYPGDFIVLMDGSSHIVSSITPHLNDNKEVLYCITTVQARPGVEFDVKSDRWWHKRTGEVSGLLNRDWSVDGDIVDVQTLFEKELK